MLKKMIKRAIYNVLNSKLLFRLILHQRRRKGSDHIYFVKVDPMKISHISVIPESSKFLSGPDAVYGSYKGPFDLFKIPFKKHFMYRTVEQLLNGEHWESTLYFKKSSKYKIKTEALKHIEKLDRIIKILSKDGYLSQYELGRANIPEKIYKWEVPLHEMIIGMDREGQFFRLKGGRHRLATAQHIGIREIPAILTLYHKDAKHKLPEKRRIITGKQYDFRPFNNFAYENSRCQIQQ